MKTRLFCCSVLLALACASASASASAQMYKWVAADGRVNYSDTPPPPDARKTERKSLNANGAAASGALPYELTQLAQTQPVTLYTMPNCAPCDEGRALLQGRGIPFSEKTVVSTEDIAALQKAGGSSALPFLQIGQVKQQGIDANTWQQLLSNAGYPANSRLPKSYQSAPAQAAAGPKPAPEPGMAYREGPPVRGRTEPEFSSNGMGVNTATPAFRF